jgi:signal peptidase I
MFTRIKAFVSKNTKKLRNITNALWLGAILLLTWYLLVGHKFGFIYNHGESMLPAFYNGEWIVTEINKGKIPERYDVVIVTCDGERLTKRIIGLEGDKIRIKHGKIFINNKEKKDPYGNGDITYWTEPEEMRAKKPKEEWLFFNTDQDVGEVPKGYVWVIGDNRHMSWYGLVKIKEIEAYVLF